MSEDAQAQEEELVALEAIYGEDCTVHADRKGCQVCPISWVTNTIACFAQAACKSSVSKFLIFCPQWRDVHETSADNLRKFSRASGIAIFIIMHQGLKFVL